jgi:starvation-inducible DNA-binding protein
MSRRPTAERHASRATYAPTSNADARSSRRLHPTRNDLRLETRTKVATMLNQLLADGLDLQLQCKQAHWNVRGENFIALHELFDDIHAAIVEYNDLMGERIVQLGGTAEGTARAVVDRTTLDAYPLTISQSRAHVEALANALAEFGRAVRAGIEELDTLGDADSTDILTEISRGTDKWLWFVEAHEVSRVAQSGNGDNDR